MKPKSPPTRNHIDRIPPIFTGFKNKLVEHNPKIGDVKYKRRFAWFPKRIGIYRIWLRWYSEQWVYGKNNVWLPEMGNIGSLPGVSWVKKRTRAA